MKHLIIYSHPNPKSFNHAILQTVIDTLELNKQQYRVRDLYELKFDPVLSSEDFVLVKKGNSADDVKVEQEHIRWADSLIFVFPIWWTGLGARVKGYIDRVFSFGFAYTVDDKGVKGLLSDKKALVFNTTGTPEQVYSASGMLKSMHQTIAEGIFRFCGVNDIDHRFFCAVPHISQEQRVSMLEEVRSAVKKLCH